MKKKIVLLLFVSVFIFSIVLSLDVFAKPKLEAKLDGVTENSATISWDSVGDHYDLFDLKGKKLWSGKDKKHVLNKLKSNEVIDLKLISYDQNNKIIDKVRIKTSTKESQKEKQNRLNTMNSSKSKLYFPVDNSKLQIFIKETEVKLQWETLPDDDQKYEIYKEGKYITTVDTNSYVDDKVEKNKWYRYEVKAEKSLTDAQIEKIQSKIPKEKIKKKKHLKEPKILSAVVKTTTALPKFSTSALPEGYGYLLRYETFIASKYAPNPWCKVPLLGCTKYDSFNGNKRGFRQWNFEAQSYKTLSKVYMVQSNGKKNQKLTRSIGHTVGYKKGKRIYAATATSSGIRISQIVNTSTGWQHRGVHSVGNPLVTAPNIDAEYTAKVSENGSGHFVIIHDRAPNHEMYIYTYPGDSVRTIMRDYIDPWLGFLMLYSDMPRSYHEVYVDPY